MTGGQWGGVGGCVQELACGSCLFFFFQAEDGIRDLTVTGVQTCALPICLEEVASRAGGRLWMQLYVLKDRAIARDIMQRAAAAGYEALVFTTDANVFGNREWDQRSYRAPGKPTLRTALDVLRHPRWLFEVLGRHGMPRFRNLEAFLPPSAATALGGSTVIPPLFDATISWDDITWIRQLWRGRLLIKGVLSVADAEPAAALGCDGIVLSNHGGAQE